MKKLSFADYVGPDALQLVDVEEPRAGPGQIRIAVRAVDVNAVDWRVRVYLSLQVIGTRPEP